jgi:hypothetical protein
MPDATSGQGPAPADEFDRELRELTEGTAGEPLFIEPSAAERAKAGAPWIMQARTGDRGRTGTVLLLTVLLVVVALVIWFGYVHSSSSAGSTRGTPPPNGAPAPSRATQLTGTILPIGWYAQPQPELFIDPFAQPPHDPFIRTPADHWAADAAGIVAPAARPVGGFSAAQVAAAYATARKLVIAANLDKQTLRGGPPAEFARLLTRAQRATFLTGLAKAGTDTYGNPLSTRTWVASFAPGSTDFIVDIVKVHGTMTARTVERSGTVVLAIMVNYLFAYAIEPPHHAADWMLVVDHQYGDIDFARWDDPGGALEPWDHAIIAKADVQCGAGDGFIHPAYPSEQSIETRQPGPAVSPYSMAPPPRGLVCSPTMGT